MLPRNNDRVDNARLRGGVAMTQRQGLNRARNTMVFRHLMQVIPIWDAFTDSGKMPHLKGLWRHPEGTMNNGYKFVP